MMICQCRPIDGEQIDHLVGYANIWRGSEFREASMCVEGGFPGGSVVKNLLANSGDAGDI